MMVLNVGQLIHTKLWFKEMTRKDREDFASCQRQMREDFREKLFEKAVEDYTYVSKEDLEIKKCQRPA